MSIETILAYVGIFLAVIGLITSYYFYRKSLRIKEPVYSIKSNNLISGSKFTLEKLTITYGYGNQIVQNLTVSKVLFYNQGAETISREDIETINRVRISSKSGEILDVDILQANNESNNFTLLWKSTGDGLEIDFDYLDRNQGGVIQVIHTGLSSKDLSIAGDMRGVEKLTEIGSNKFQIGWSDQTPKVDKAFFMVGIQGLVFSIFTLGLLIFTATTYPDITSSSLWPNTFTEWGTLGILFLGSILLITSVFSPSKIKIPKGLEKFLE